MGHVIHHVSLAFTLSEKLRPNIQSAYNNKEQYIMQILTDTAKTIII